MKKSELREFLNRPNVPFSTALHKVTEFILEPNNKAIIANYIVTALKSKQNSKSKDIFSLFYIATRSLVSKTKLCNTIYAEQSLLRSVWINSQFQNIIIALVKQNYRLLPIKEEVITVEKEPELTREQRLAKQAAIMREAKARKRAERLAKEKAEKEDKHKYMPQTKEKGVSVAHKSEEKRVAEVTQPVETKKFSKEQLEQIELLKRMRN